jgi:hypothetical protein
VARLEDTARRSGARVLRGGPYARWDLEVSGGAAGAARLLVSVEEHGRGRQLMRCRIWPRVASPALRVAVGLGVLVAGTAVAGEWVATAVLAALLAALGALAAWECGLAVAGALAAVDATDEPEPDPSPPTDLAAVLAPHLRRLAPIGAKDA